VAKKKKKVWVLYTDTHNGSTDFWAFASEKGAQAAFVRAFNNIYGARYKLFRSAELMYEIENAKPFNDNWIRLEELELLP
jgi:hypothetical protein